jgi:hypothetical protein
VRGYDVVLDHDVGKSVSIDQDHVLRDLLGVGNDHVSGVAVDYTSLRVAL